MYPRAFQYYRPRSVAEAIALLADLGEEARLLAGGQSLIPLMKLRLASPQYIIDIGRLPNLAFIEASNGVLNFGALTRHATLGASSLVAQRLPIMHDAAQVIADVQVRNLGTLGGALAEADPAGDWGPVCLALGAEVTCQGPKGERTLPLKEFFRDAYTPALEPTEVLTRVAVPLPQGTSGGAYLSWKRRAGDFAVVSVAVQLLLGEGQVCREVGIGLGAVGLTPLRPEGAEAALRGKPLTEAVIRTAADKAAEAADPFADLRGSVEYKRELVHTLFQRAVRIALQRSQGESVEVRDV